MSEVILATGGYDEKVVLWNPSTEVASRVIPLKDVHVSALAVTPDRQYIAVAAYKSLKLFDLQSNSTIPVHTYDGHSGNITAIGFPKRSNWLYTASEDGTIRIWDFNTNRSQRCYEGKTGVNTAVLHPNQSELIAGYEDGLLAVWDIASSSYRIVVNPDEEAIRTTQIAGDARFGVYGNNLGVITVWTLDGDQFRILGRIQAHNNLITKCVLSMDSKLLATCSADKTVKIWNVNLDSEELLGLDKALIGHKMWVWDANFTCDSAYIATASTDATAKLWEVSSGRIARNYIGVHSKGICSLVLNDLTI